MIKKQWSSKSGTADQSGKGKGSKMLSVTQNQTITLLGTPVSLFIHAFIQSANHTAAAWCVKSSRSRSRASVHLHINHQNEEKDLCDFWMWRSCWFLTQYSWEFTQNNKKKNCVGSAWETPRWRARSEKHIRSHWSWQIHTKNSVQMWWAEKHLKKSNTSKLQVGELQTGHLM